jgi:WD40 repeat protein
MHSDRNEFSLFNVEDGTLRLKAKDRERTPDGRETMQIYANCALDCNTFLATLLGDVKSIIPGRNDRFEKGSTKIHWTMLGHWDARTDKVTQSFRVEPLSVEQLFLSPDRKTVMGFGQLAIGGDTHLFAWDPRTAKELFRIRLPSSSGYASALLCSDGKSILVNGTHSNTGIGGDGFYLYDISTGILKSKIEQVNAKGTFSCCLVANESLAAVSRKDTIYLIDPLTGKELGRLTSSEEPIRCLAFSADGKLLASASADTTALIWDTARFVKTKE